MRATDTLEEALRLAEWRRDVEALVQSSWRDVDDEESSLIVSDATEKCIEKV